jgi:hypothetical protein
LIMSIRTPSIAAVSVLFALACKGDATGGAPRRAAASSTVGSTVESPGEVIIAPASAAYTVAPVAAPATVSGTVTFKAALAATPPVSSGADSSSCGTTVVEDAGVAAGGAAGVVVWLEGVRSGKALGLERRLELESTNCKLTPRMQAAVTGSAVNILGHDQFRQHLRFVAGGETAPRATILLGGGEQVIPTELPFKTAGMVAVRDAGHAWTHAWLAVFDHPYYAITGVGGAFTIDGVPPGKYTLKAWHDRAAVASQSVDVGANGAVKVTIELEPK